MAKAEGDLMSESTVDTPALGENSPSTPPMTRQHDAAGNPLQPTAKDAAGTERVIGRAVDGWTPAPVDPDPRLVSALEKANFREAQASAERQEALTSSETLGDTAQPLVDANAARDEEHEQLLDNPPEPVEEGEDNSLAEHQDPTEAARETLEEEPERTDGEVDDNEDGV